MSGGSDVQPEAEWALLKVRKRSASPHPRILLWCHYVLLAPGLLWRGVPKSNASSLSKEPSHSYYWLLPVPTLGLQEVAGIRKISLFNFFFSWRFG